jgi:elongation factor G
MGQTTTSMLRTVALVGHGAAGKTTLAESLLAAAGEISSRGSRRERATPFAISTRRRRNSATR